MKLISETNEIREMQMTYKIFGKDEVEILLTLN